MSAQEKATWGPWCPKHIPSNHEHCLHLVAWALTVHPKHVVSTSAPRGPPAISSGGQGSCYVLSILSASSQRDGKGGKCEKRGGNRDTKAVNLIEKEKSTPQSNICPLFCITIHWDFHTGHDVVGIKAEISFQPFIHNCYVWKRKKKEREKVGETKVNTKREMLTCVAQNVYIRQSSACSSTMALKSRCHSSCTRLKHRDHYVQNEWVFIQSLLQLLRMCFLLCRCLLEGLHLYNGEIFHSHLPPTSVPPSKSTVMDIIQTSGIQGPHCPILLKQKLLCCAMKACLRQNKAVQQWTLREYLWGSL